MRFLALFGLVCGVAFGVIGGCSTGNGHPPIDPDCKDTPLVPYCLPAQIVPVRTEGGTTDGPEPDTSTPADTSPPVDSSGG